MTDTIEPRATTGRLTVNPGDSIASVWGNTTYDQTMEVFDTPAQRDAQWPTPHDGALAYTVDLQLAWIRRAGAWVQFFPPPTANPRGVLAQATSVANTTGTTTTVDWFIAPAFTVDGTRRVRVTYSGTGNPGTANDTIGLYLQEGATILQIAQARCTAAGSVSRATLANVWEGIPVSGSHQYKLTLALMFGTGPATGVAAANNPALLLVEDIGI
jgi:hypothetical protein